MTVSSLSLVQDRHFPSLVNLSVLDSLYKSLSYLAYFRDAGREVITRLEEAYSDLLVSEPWIL